MAISTCSEIKEKLQEIMEEVIASGKDAFIKLPGEKYLHLAFEMLEKNKEAMPICNVFLLNEEGELLKVLYERVQEDEKIYTTGSIQSVFGLCKE
jgi:hypothetical protein